MKKSNALEKVEEIAFDYFSSTDPDAHLKKLKMRMSILEDKVWTYLYMYDFLGDGITGYTGIDLDFIFSMETKVIGANVTILFSYESIKINLNRRDIEYANDNY